MCDVRSGKTMNTRACTSMYDDTITSDQLAAANRMSACRMLLYGHHGSEVWGIMCRMYCINEMTVMFCLFVC